MSNIDIDIEYKLVEKIKDELAFPPSTTGVIVEYLNRHGWIRTAHEAEAAARGEVPGRTITESELSRKLANVPPYADNAVWLRAVLNALGITVVPDPEPSNAEKLEAIWADWKPDYEGIGEFLDRRGVKAPEADDE